MGFRFECGEESFFGQTEGWVKCFHQREPNPVFQLDWALFDNGKYFIQMVEVDREWRRQGVATQMYRELFRDRKISQHDLISTPKTQDGMAFRQNMRLALAPAEEYQKAKTMTKTSSKKKPHLKKGWTDAPEIELSDSQLDKIFQSGKPKSKSKKKASSVHVAQAYMNREAALSEWFQWMAQPVQSILKHHREFVLGPVHDLIDTVIKSIAPTLVKELAEAEVEQDLRDFERGAAAGKADRASGKPASPSRNDTEEFQEGYVFGYENGRAEIPSSMRRSLIEESLKEFKSEVTIQVMTTLLKKVWHAVNPVNTVKALIAAVKKHGWKLGVGMALFEIFEHFVLPSILTYLFDDPRLLAMATLPIGEVIYAIVLRVIGRAPKELNKVTEDGHLDWYEQEFGPVRLACLQT